MPGWAHEDPTERVLHRPSTAATLHLAAVAAKGARLFRAADPAYSRTLLHVARTAYQAARRQPDLIAPDDNARFGGGPYADGELDDDFYWAAVEMWLTTDEEVYRREVLSSALHAADAIDPAGFDFDRVTAVGQLDLALAGRHLVDFDRVIGSLRLGAGRLLELQRHRPGASLTPQLRGGIGGPTAGSSTTL
jgi:endoglucanase